MSTTAKIIKIQDHSANSQNSEALLLQSRLLLDLTKKDATDKGEVEESFKFRTESAAAGLDTERASVWLYNRPLFQGGSKLRLQSLY